VQGSVTVEVDASKLIPQIEAGLHRVYSTRYHTTSNERGARLVTRQQRKGGRRPQSSPPPASRVSQWLRRRRSSCLSSSSFRFSSRTRRGDELALLCSLASMPSCPANSRPRARYVQCTHGPSRFLLPYPTVHVYGACLRAARLKLTPSLSLYYLSRFSFTPAPPSPTRIGCEVPRGCMDRRWRFAERRAGAHALCAQDCGLHQRKRVP
jgi:hypothetical protein